MKKSPFPCIAELLASIVLIVFASCSDNNNPLPPKEPVLTITGFYPSSGLVGSSMAIYGDQFIPTVPPEKGVGPFTNTSIVAFNGTVAEAENVYQDSIGKQYISLKVPAATSGKITVTANGKTVSSLDDFIISVPTYLSAVDVTTVPAYGLDVAIDSEGSLYVTHKEPNEIVKITPDGIPHTLWSSAIGEIPKGIAVDANGNVFATIVGSYVLKISVDGKTTTLAGSTQSGAVDGQGSLARFNFPDGIALDPDGNIYVADLLNYKIRKITANGTVSTLAGSTMGFKDGTGTNAQFAGPNDVTLDAEGNVYVTDGNRIRKITSAGLVSTVAGSMPGYLDGTTAHAQFNQLTGIDMDTSGNLYTCDLSNYVVRRIAPDGTVVTVAGSTAGYLDGSGSTAKFAAMLGIERSTSGVLYIAQSDAPMRKIVIH